MSKGINNWREAMWIIIILAWTAVTLGSLIGVVDITASEALAGTKAIVLGLIAHVLWVNFIAPNWSRGVK